MADFLATEAKIDGPTFRRFALYDTFGRRKRWRQPLIFFLMMGAFAAACYFSGREGGRLLGAVLMSVGTVLPAVYVLAFLWSVRQRAKRMDGDAVAYRLRLSPDGLAAEAGGHKVRAPWAKLFAARRAPGCVYIYVNQNKAFLWPEDGQDVWGFIKGHRSDLCA